MRSQESLELQLIQAIKNHDLEQVKSIVNNNPGKIDFDYIYEDRATTNRLSISAYAIEDAIKSDDTSIISFLMDEGVTITGQNTYFTALGYVITKENIKLIRFFLDRGCDPNEKSFYAHPLHLANNNREIIKILMEKGADQNNTYEENDFDYNKITPLIKAIEAKEVELCKLLLDYNADINKIDGSGLSPLTAAIKSGQYDLALLLINHKADIDKIDGTGLSPLTAAIKSGQYDLALLLINHKADLDKIDGTGLSPLTAAIKSKQYDLALLLKEKGANVNQEDKKGKVPAKRYKGDDMEMRIALSGKQKEIKRGVKSHLKNLCDGLIEAYPDNASIKSLVEEIARINNADLPFNSLIYSIQKLLAQFVEKVDKEIIKLIQKNIRSLLDYIIGIIQVGYNAIHCLVLTNDYEGIKEYLANTGNINEQTDKYKNTALHLAVINGDVEMTKFLLNNGADPALKDVKGRIPADYAILFDNKELMALFKIDIDDKHKKAVITKAQSMIGFGLYRHQVQLHGDYVDLSLDMLPKLFAKFVEQSTDDKNTLTDIAKLLNKMLELSKMNIKEKLTHLEKEGYLFGNTGARGHATGYIIHKINDDQYKLTLVDRGLFMSAFKDNVYIGNEKKFSMQSINVPQSDLMTVLEEMSEASQVSSEMAKVMLFERIPLIVKGDWKSEPGSKQKKLKYGSCFYDNIKSIILYELLQKFPEDKAKLKYKEFVLFLKKEIKQRYDIDLDINEKTADVEGKMAAAIQKYEKDSVEPLRNKK